MARFDRRRWALFAISTGALLALTACAPPAPAEPAAAARATSRETSVKAAPVVRADIATSLAYSGDVRAKSSLIVIPKATGRIEKIGVDVGTVVKVGDVIAELDKEQATLQLRQAEANLAAARARQAQVQSGGRPDQVVQAEAMARAARARVQALQSASRTELVAQAQANLDAARQRLEALKNPRSESVGQAEANVRAAESRLEQLKKGPTAEQVRAAEIGVEQAKNALYAVQTQRDATCRGGGFACDAANEQTQAGEAAVRAAQQQLKLATAPPTAEALAQAEAAVAIAREQLSLALKPASDPDLLVAENAVRAAEAGLQLARSPVLASDIEAARAQAEAAEAGARLAAQPFTRQDLEAAAAAVTQAEAGVEMARQGLKEMTVLAPAAGVIADRFLVPGAIASPSTPIVTISAPEVEIVVSVEENQIGRIAAGQDTRITVPALPGEALAGKVQLVPPTVDPRSRTAQVRIAPDAASTARLRPGMFAQVTVQADRKVGALVVPRSAILTDGGPAVFSIDGGVVKRQAVVLGIQDRDQVEILQGLRDGDQVVLDAVDLRDGDRVAVAAAR